MVRKQRMGVGGLVLVLAAVALGAWTAWEIGDEAGSPLGSGDVAFQHGRATAPAYTYVGTGYPAYGGIVQGGIPPEQLVGSGIAGEAITALPELDGKRLSDMEGRDVYLSGLQVKDVRSDRSALVDVGGREALVVLDDRPDEALAPGQVLWITEGEIGATADLDDPDELGVDAATMQRLPWYVDADEVRMSG